MGARNLTCVRVNREWVFAKYGHWDDYPSVQAVRLHKFLHIEGNIARLRAGLPHIYEPTEEDWARVSREVKAEMTRVESLGPKDLDDYLERHVPRYKECDLEYRKDREFYIPDKDMQSKILFPSLSRDIGAQILELVANATADHKLPIQSELEYANGCLDCGWAYIVDLDEEQLKIFAYSGPKYEGHPFEDVGGDKEEVPAFVTSFTFSELRSWDDEGFRCRANEIQIDAEDMIWEHYSTTIERLQQKGTFLLDGGFSQDENENNEGDYEDAGEKDTHGRGANDDGVDNTRSKLDQLHLD